MSENRESVYGLSAVDFVDQVMRPSEYLANIFLNAGDELLLPNIPKGDLEAIGLVYATLTAHAKHRLHDALGKMEEKTGKIEVIQELFEIAHTEAIAVTIKTKE